MIRLYKIALMESSLKKWKPFPAACSLGYCSQCNSSLWCTRSLCGQGLKAWCRSSVPMKANPRSYSKPGSMGFRCDLPSAVRRPWKKGMPSQHTIVYEADRPELFFKSLPPRRRARYWGVYIRKRIPAWNVPEPELTLFINASWWDRYGYTCNVWWGSIDRRENAADLRAGAYERVHSEPARWWFWKIQWSVTAVGVRMQSGHEKAAHLKAALG